MGNRLLTTGLACVALALAAPVAAQTGPAPEAQVDIAAIPDVVSDFVYLRLQKGKDSVKTGYQPKALDAWAKRLRSWAKGSAPADLPLVDKKNKAPAKPRDVYAYFIHEGKVRAPAAAMATIERLK